VEARVLDRNGEAVLTLHEPLELAAGGRATVKLSGTLSQPQLWEPAYPYLYRVDCSIRRGGETIDSTEVPLGIRAVHWDVHTGFSINGHHLKLHGWGQRPTDEWPGLGTAQPDWLHYYTLNLMKEAGGNFLRWGHCAGGPGMIRAGDELGFVTDQPGVDGEADTVGAAWEIRAAAFRDVIIYYRNDPSILIWEGGNQKVTKAHARELRHFVDEYDPHGGRAYAHRRADETTGQFMDISIGTEGSHEVARLPVVEGEYDREESPRRIWDDATPPDFGYPAARGQTYDLTSEQFAVNEVGQYVNKVGAESDCGGGNWIFSDTTSGGRDTVEVDRASGEVDGVRLPKQAYYVCRSMFRDDPQVHIIGHWNYPAGTKKTVYVTSNCQRVKLYVNGKEIGQTNATEHYLFTFPDVAWQAGEIKAVACNEEEVPMATNEIRTAGAPVALRLTPITGPGGLQADGSDVALIDVEAVDAKGERCPTFERRVNFACAGPAVWRGGYDSGKADSINHKYLDLEAGINRVAVRSTLEAGDIVVAATCPGLKPGSVTIRSRSFALEDGYSTILPALPVAALPAQHPDWSELASVPAMSVRTAAGNGTQAGRYTESFNYTGPTELVHVEADAMDGKNVYCDCDVAFTNLPAKLTGADWVQAAAGDRDYSAADLMQLAVKGGATVYVALDSGLSSPEWLQRQFQPTKLALAINGRGMNVFSRHLRTDESLTLGANTQTSSGPSCNMYVVFVRQPENDYHVSR